MSLEQEIHELAGRRSVLVATDFDGVVAPLVETPDLAIPDERAVALLTELSRRKDVGVAVISGRDRADLALRLGTVPGAILIGEHGNDSGQPAGESRVLDDARELVGSLQATMPLAIVEEKPRSVTFHTRRLDRGDSLAARRALESWVDGRTGIVLLEGKEVFELTVATRTKGDAVLEMAEPFDVIVYFGDDVTDESVFEVLEPGDIGIKVGPGATVARHRVDDVDAVVGVLERIIEAVDRRSKGSTNE